MRQSLSRLAWLGFVLLLTACTRVVVATPTPTATPTAPSPRSLAEAYVEAFNSGDIEGLLTLFGEKVAFSLEPLIWGARRGKAEAMGGALEAMSHDWEIAITSASVRANTLAGEFSLSTQGPVFTGTVQVEFEEGKITRIEHVLDEKSLEKLRGPEGYVLTDPMFQALEGAQALFGELDGTIYRIEIPDNWNERLVLWAHGFRFFELELRVDPPPFREYLIESGYAWAASSFSANGFLPSKFAHDTAAPYDFFVQEFGQPEYTYITGVSMGGNITLLSLELFPSRYDGALALCSVVGLDTLDYFGHYLSLSAYAAGVAQEEWEAAESLDELLRERILPALEADPQARSLFESLVATLTGGPRPFRHEGFEQFYDLLFTFTGVIESGEFDNTDFAYSVDPASGVSAEELNARVVRIRGDPQVRNVDPSASDLAGAAPVPLLMLHTTGDGWVPFSSMQIFQRLADVAGNGDLLVQRAIRDPGHCGFSSREMTAALEDLFNWVENGVKAEGEDILGPLQHVGLRFTDPLREGDPGRL